MYAVAFFCAHFFSLQNPCPRRDFFRTGSFTEIKFAVQNAFLKFTVAGNTAVAITDNGTGLFSGELSNFSAGEHYVAIKANAKDVAEEKMVKYTFKYTAGEFEKETTTFAPVAGTIYNLYYIGEPQKAYLNANVWNTENAWFAAYFFNKTPNAVNTRAFAEYTWVKMTDVEGFGVYECEVPYGYNSVIFCRMAATATEANFGTWDGVVLNQTVDLTINVAADDYENTNTYTVTSWDNQMGNTPTGGNWGAKPAAPTYGVVGSFQGWDVAKPVVFVFEKDYWYVAEDIELYKNDEFKVVTGNSWDNPNYGKGEAGVLNVDEETDLVLNGQNMQAAKNGKFDIYFNVKTHQIKYTCVKEYTDLTVNITIDNKANWSPLYITLMDGNTTVVTNAPVNNNKYAVSGDYIGKELSYTLSNGSKTSEGKVSITKNGATINLEETIIKLKVQLNTANAKQWWGNTMKIHAWNTGTSFDTSWPGNTMTSEGNYTWSIVVPSELVGKTINFLVHNGNGWQSSDSKVTIKAEGNTVTGSSIGIN